MRIVNYFKNILSNLYLSLRRFPLTILISASIAAVLITIHEIRPAEDNLAKLAMVLALGIPLSLSIKLFFERKNEENTSKVLLSYGAGAVILTLYYLFLLKGDVGMVTVTRYTAVSLALYMTFLFIPYFPGKDGFEMYVIQIATGFFTTIIYSIVLFGGLAAILFAMDTLLGIVVLGKVYYYTWLFVVFLFAVSYFLSGIPVKDKVIFSKSYPKLLRILILYIIMPLLTAYTLILYAYFGKIIITRTWPVGLVSHLVLWYSVIVTLVLFFITPILHESSWAHRFLKIFPKVLLPLIMMMFISIGIRINAYGVTEPRYYVVILALWVFCIMIYYSFSKKLKNIFIPLSFAVLAVISVFGPLSSYSISKYSQNSRLEKILMENNMLKDSTIQSSDKLSRENKAHISSILTYFNRNHSLKDVKYLPENFKMEDINKVFGFTYESPIYQSNEYFYFRRKLVDKGLDVKDYDYFFDMASLYNKDASQVRDIDANYVHETSTLTITYLGNEIYKKSLDSFVQNILDKYGIQNGENPLSDEEMTLVEENDKIKVKIVFQNISGSKNNSTGEINHKSIDFYLLVKVK